MNDSVQNITVGDKIDHEIEEFKVDDIMTQQSSGK